MSEITDSYGVLDLGAEVMGSAGPAIAAIELDRSRSGVLVTVDSGATDPIFFKVVRRGAPKPAISEATFHLRVGPGTDRTVNWGGNLDLYAYCPGNAAFTALPVRF